MYTAPRGWAADSVLIREVSFIVESIERFHCTSNFLFQGSHYVLSTITAANTVFECYAVYIGYGYISVLDSCILNVFRLLITTTTATTMTKFLYLRQQFS